MPQFNGSLLRLAIGAGRVFATTRQKSTRLLLATEYHQLSDTQRARYDTHTVPFVHMKPDRRNNILITIKRRDSNDRLPRPKKKEIRRKQISRASFICQAITQATIANLSFHSTMSRSQRESAKMLRRRPSPFSLKV